MPGKIPRPPGTPHGRPLHEAGDYVAWGLMALAGLVGLFMASGAHDDEIYLFGWSMSGMAVLFLLSELKGHYDAADARAQEARQ